jgi:translation initiation factor IF-3
MRNKGGVPVPMESKVKVNEKIKAPKVRVVSAVYGQLGILSISDALKKAKELDLDLVEVSPNADPPVCKIMDYGKFRYEETKKDHDRRKRQARVILKEIKVRPRTDEHDIIHKSKQILGFLTDKCKVKVTVMFRGRESSHPEQATRLVNQILELVKGYAQVEQPSKFEGRNMTMILAPKAA